MQLIEYVKPLRSNQKIERLKDGIHHDSSIANITTWGS
jgi:hypothetical protein